MMMKAVLTSSTHPEYGEITIPFPIFDEDYDRTIELLEGLGIGDVFTQDCRIIKLESAYPVLDRLEGSAVNLDELDYLAKRLESFCESEDTQFQAMAHKLELTDIKDLINLSFCCQDTTVITDFSDLEEIGREHRINRGGLTADEYYSIDGRAEALELIRSRDGTVTPYGVVYDNGMELKQLYDGQSFPPYLYKVPIIELKTTSGGGLEGHFDLPMPDQRLQREIERAGLDRQDIPLKVELSGLRGAAADALDLDRLTAGDLPELNRLCRAVEPLTDQDWEKLDAVARFAVRSDFATLCRLAENLDLFDFVPNVHTAEEYGKYLIQKSGKFAYDAKLRDIYDYRGFGEDRVWQEDGCFTECGYVAYHGTELLEELIPSAPTEEQGMQMGGLS